MTDKPTTLPETVTDEELTRKLMARVRAVELPPAKRAAIIVQAATENWPKGRLKWEMEKAKIRQLFEQLYEDLQVEAKQELRQEALANLWDSGEVTPC